MLFVQWSFNNDKSVIIIPTNNIAADVKFKSTLGFNEASDEGKRDINIFITCSIIFPTTTTFTFKKLYNNQYVVPGLDKIYGI